MARAAGSGRRPITRRSAVLPVHRWVGLTLGLVALASAITGAGMAFRKQLDPLVYPHMLQAPACAARQPLDAFVAKARALHPKGQLDYIRLLREPGSPVIARFTDKDTYFFDPCSTALLGEQNRYAGVFGQLERIHRFAFVKNGGWLMGSGAAALALGLALGGLTVWWPRRPQRLRDTLKLNTNLRGRAFEIGLHRSLGAWVAIPLLVSSLTALPTAFDGVRAAVDAATGTQVDAPPRSAPPPKGAGKAKKIGMEQAWRAAQALSPSPREALLHLPLKAASPIEIFIIGADAPHANARTYLYLDAYSGRVLRYSPYAAMGLGEKAYYWALSIHTGEVGGVFGQFLLFLGAISVPVLAYLGIGSWLRRKLPRKPPPGRPAAGRPSPPGAPRQARVERIVTEAPGVKSFRLVSADGAPLAPAEPGAHINVSPRPGVVRQYSLTNGPDETDAYTIAVRRDSASRGGSRAMHDDLKEGDILPIGEPRNHFPLQPQAASHLLLARGVGITPILAMAKALAARGARFRLEYFTRSAEHTPFRAVLEGAAFEGRVRFHHGLEPDHQARLIHELLAHRDPGTHLYVCGGGQFIKMVEAAAQAWPASAVHREHFGADPCAWAGERRAFDVRLARSGRTIHVPADRTLAAALGEAGVELATSCEQGVCGSCLTRVLAGRPDHRDVVLSALEREQGEYLTPCVSRALGAEITLDL